MGSVTDARIAGWQKAAGIEPATGKRAEALAELSRRAYRLIQVIELERSGIRDGAGSWYGSDVLGGTIVGCALPLARPFFANWIDPEHVQSGTILSILVVPQFFNIGARFGHCILVGMARIGTFNTAALIAGLVNLLLSVIFIQRWGIVGVAVGTLIPMVIVDAVWFVLYMGRLLDVSPLRIWTRSIAPGIVVAAAGLLTGTGMTR